MRRDSVRLRPHALARWLSKYGLASRSEARAMVKAVYDLLPAGAPWVPAAGRLDADTSGLLVFTNDTGLASWIPEAGGVVEKEYVATVRGTLSPQDASRFEKGVVLDGRRTLPARCEILHRGGETATARVASDKSEGCSTFWAIRSFASTGSV